MKVKTDVKLNPRGIEIIQQRDAAQRESNPLTALRRSLEVLHHGVVVDPAQHLFLHQAKLLPRGQLPLARVAREARQVVRVAPGAPHPVAGVDLTPAAGTLSTKPTVRDRRREAAEARETRRRRSNVSWMIAMKRRHKCGRNMKP